MVFKLATMKDPLAVVLIQVILRLLYTGDILYKLITYLTLYLWYYL
jgi:hypothetical protein